MRSRGLTLNEYKELFKSHYPSLCLFANSYLKDHSGSKDVVQDAFISLWEKKTDFELQTSARSYLYTVVKNRCIDILRSSRVRLTENHVKIETLQRKDTDLFFYKEVVTAETTSILHTAIKELPPKCAKIITLAMRGFTNDDIATELSISVNTVKTQKKIAYSKLRELLQKWR